MTELRVNRRPGLRQVVSLLIVTVFAGGVAADTPRIESGWIAEAPAIDGQLKDWGSSLVSLGSAPLSVGVRNDGAFLYIALAASEPATRMLLGRAGFTLWWDPAGKDKKSSGITIPPTMAGRPGMRGRGQFGGPPDRDGQPPSQGAPPQGQSGPPQQGQDGQRPSGPVGLAIEPIGHVEVIGPGKDDRRRLELAFAKTVGLDVATRMGEGVLIYEIRVPLSASEGQPYAVRSTPGGTIGLGIETGEMPRPGGRGDEGGGRRGGIGGGPPGGGGGGGRGGGGMGGGGGRGGGTGGGREGGMREMKPIKTWVVVHLSKPPA